MLTWGALFNALLALLFVLSLIGLTAFGLRRIASGRMPMMPSKEGRRLSVVEVLPLDMRRRLVLVRHDDTEHLLLLSPERELVVESSAAAKPKRKR